MGRSIGSEPVLLLIFWQKRHKSVEKAEKNSVKKVYILK